MAEGTLARGPLHTIKFILIEKRLDTPGLTHFGNHRFLIDVVSLDQGWAGSQPAGVFEGAGQNDCTFLLYLSTKHVFETL